MIKILDFTKKNAVLLIAVTVAIATSFIVPPDGEYLKYFDLSTIFCLLGTLAVVCALSDAHFFEIIARKIVSGLKDSRKIVFALVFITYFGSMIMANDMALITFLPLGYFALTQSGKQKYMAYTFVMQNVAANLGGMLTPFGNPQNLYLYSYFSIPTGEFFLIMLPPFITALLLIAACCFFVKKENAEIIDDSSYSISPLKLTVYLILFACSVLSVMRVYPYYIGVSITLVGVAIMDIKAYKSVNYGLILTFCAFFVFSGNASRIPLVHEIIGNLLEKNTLLFSILSCQIISNVPTATLLCRFMGNYKALLAGVNIGGLGTPVASLASLITLGEYKRRGSGIKKYVGLFLAINFSFLLVLTVVETIFGV